MRDNGQQELRGSPVNPPPMLLPRLALPLLFRLADLFAVPGVPAPCRNATFRICTGVSCVVIATRVPSGCDLGGGVSWTRDVDAIGG